MKNFLSPLIFISFFINISFSFFSQGLEKTAPSSDKYAKEIYYEGVRYAKKGDLNFAFMCFDSILAYYPDSKFTPAALFATGEYYFLTSAKLYAWEAFNKFIKSYPQSKIKPFALAYLIKMSAEKKESEKERLERELITSCRVSLVFRDFKEINYLSPLMKSYKAIYFIDKVEIYVDDRLFLSLPFIKSPQ